MRSIQIPRAVLWAPVAAAAAYLLIALRPVPPAPPPRDESSAAATTAPQLVEAEDDPAALEESSAEGDPEAVEEAAPSPAVVAVNIAELERTRQQAERAAQQLEDARRRVKVELYTTERCTRCVEARSHLIAQGIHPTERDIDKDPRARARHRALSRKRGLPTIVVDNKVLVGFHPERLDKAIERAAKLRLSRKR